MSWPLLLGVLPWVILGAGLVFWVRAPRPLDPDPISLPSDSTPSVSTPSVTLPSVTIIVPARNEAFNIVECLTSLARQDYPDFEIIVVNDGSTDGTGELARGVPPGNAKAIRVIEGAPLPEGWFGKPWACTQGAREARGEFLLFTDADTRHAPDLLRRAMAGMREDGAHALTLNGLQIAETFGERLIQPQIFALIGIRYPRLDHTLPPERAEDAIANGQYILVEREVYERVGGHEAVRGEVAEDLRLAQELTGAGYPVRFRGALDGFSTRMYRSLGDAIEGWTKNIAVGGRQAAGRLGVLALPGMIGFLILFWIVPPVVLAGSAIEAIVSFSYGAAPEAESVAADPSSYGAAPEVTSLAGDSSSYGAAPAPAIPLRHWALCATLVSLVTWMALYWRFRLPVRYALLYPVGAALASYIVARSWARGSRRIEWRGRRYSQP